MVSNRKCEPRENYAAMLYIQCIYVYCISMELCETIKIDFSLLYGSIVKLVGSDFFKSTKILFILD